MSLIFTTVSNGQIQDHTSPNITATHSRNSDANNSIALSQGNNRHQNDASNTINNKLGAISPANSAVRLTNEVIALAVQNDPVLFLSVNVNRNQTIARAVKLEMDDKTTFQNLKKQYWRLCGKWFRAKHITGIKFYRVCAN